MEQIEVSKEKLIPQMREMLASGARWVTATCLDLGEEFEVVYHLDKNLTITNIRVKIKKGETLPSLSGIYPCAMLIENEIQDYFGLNFEGISLDLKGTLLLAKGYYESPPMLKEKK
jgi:NADH:ubiquinone oxidoreductase subunit C